MWKGPPEILAQNEKKKRDCRISHRAGLHLEQQENMNNPPRSSADNTLPVHRNPNSRAVNLGDVESVGLVTVTERGTGGAPYSG